MSKTLLPVAAAAVAIAACRQPPPAPTSPPPAPSTADEARAVEQVLRDWYNAMEHGDSAGTARPLTASFFIYEDTTKLRRDALVAGVVGGFGAGTQTAELSDIETTVRGDVAWSSFRNHEVFTPKNGPPQQLYFVETVVFVKDSVWKIDRYHATRINRGR